MAQKKENAKFMVEGKARYCSTKKPNNKGKFPSHCYEVCIEVEDVPKEIEQFVKTKEDETEDGIAVVETIKISNSKYPIPLFKMDKTRADNDNVSIPNGTKIKLAVEVRHSDKYDTDYLVCNGIQLQEELKEYNPFE